MIDDALTNPHHMSEQDAYDLGYRHPATHAKQWEFRHVVDVNAYRCGQLDAQNQAPRNSDYRREDYDPETFERNHTPVSFS